MHLRLFLTVLLVLTGLLSALAETKLPRVFGSHMVLQRDMLVPVWGTDAPGQAVTVKFRKQEKKATADSTGKWMVKLDALEAGGPDALTVSGSSQVTVEDVLVGEVWIGSGQSNMAFGCNKCTGDKALAEAIAAGPYPKIRLFISNPNDKDKDAGVWKEASAENLPPFSAILFSFGLKLHKELDVPVGLVVGAVGGTPSGQWIGAEMVDADPATQEAIKAYVDTYKDLKKKFDEAVERQKAEPPPQAGAKAVHLHAPPGPLTPGKAGGVGKLFEGFIRPVIPFAIRGVLWDQGESGTSVGGVSQYVLMGALISGWRKAWGQGDFPFIYVQKPSGGGSTWKPESTAALTPLPRDVPSEAPQLEVHLMIRNYPATYMAISSDLGGGLHPGNKLGYGTRAARVALSTTYGRKDEFYGPTYDSFAVEGNKVRIRFQHIGGGLVFQPADKPQGFAVAGADKVFQWADAKIDGDTILVSSDKVSAPVAVRYGWGDSRPWANLFSKSTLPAIPFRTDTWAPPALAPAAERAPAPAAATSVPANP